MKLFGGSGTLHDSIVARVPALKRGQVWCTVCGHTERVDSAQALRQGWPKHCGCTMTIDSPEERAANGTQSQLLAGDPEGK